MSDKHVTPPAIFVLEERIAELEKKLAVAVKHIKQHCGDALICPELTCYHSMDKIKKTEEFLESLEEKEGAE